MIPDILRPLIRRAILDLVLDVGGEQTDLDLTVLMAELGHRVARVDVAGEIGWLADRDLLKSEQIGPFLTVRSTDTGRDTARGLLRIAGISPHKTGE